MKRMPQGLYIFFILLLYGQSVVINAEPISDILETASELVGTPYRHGGISTAGFDCSGFVSHLYLSTVPAIPRRSRDMALIGKEVKKGQWQPGDLLFYATGANRNNINHVAIWYGEGKIVHSVSGGPQTGVIITPANAKYWSKRYKLARRVLPDNAPAPREDESEGDTGKHEKTPWDEFDGMLQGDFESWIQSDKDNFEAYKEKNSTKGTSTK